MPVEPSWKSRVVSVVWPNEESGANSDPWLIANHDRIRLMQPRVLAINFVSGLREPEAREQLETLCRGAARVLALAGLPRPGGTRRSWTTA